MVGVFVDGDVRDKILKLRPYRQTQRKSLGVGGPRQRDADLDASVLSRLRAFIVIETLVEFTSNQLKPRETYSLVNQVLYVERHAAHIHRSLCWPAFQASQLLSHPRRSISLPNRPSFTTRRLTTYSLEHRCFLPLISRSAVAHSSLGVLLLQLHPCFPSTYQHPPFPQHLVSQLESDTTVA